MKCPICHGPLKGEAYCPNCGQAITYEGIKQTYSDISDPRFSSCCSLLWI